MAASPPPPPPPPAKSSSKLHVAMFPWFALGHMTPFLHLSNQLAARGHTVSFLLPKGAEPQMEPHNLHPTLVRFFPLTLPPVDGLPPGAATASDLPFPLHTHLCTALDRTRHEVHSILTSVNPHVIIFDLGCWIPALARSHGIKSVYYAVVCAAGHALRLVPSLKIQSGWTAAELMLAPPGCPFPGHLIRPEEAKQAVMLARELGSGMTMYDRLVAGMTECDAIALRTFREVEGPFCDYIADQYSKPVLLTGPNLTETPEGELEERWSEWLSKFDERSVVFCALGSQITLEKEQFEELLLGFELCGMPFLAVLRPPEGSATVEEALPEGFAERVEGRGVVHGGWIQQPLVLRHPAVGCFVSHCGFGSMWESLFSDCRIVLVPRLGDQIVNAVLMAEQLKVAVEVERDEDGGFRKESVCKAIKLVMDEEGEGGKVVKENHAKWREIVSSPELQNGYIDSFIQSLLDLLDD
ncbi:UDP-glycosyltransferase 79B3-like [Malania oleifera]|uniref:UDP-glycosyltransferase 79B3-like n=1 Tax=Malania oleifera TaxID=397392 RepID=UPI0025AEC0CF|nr:UDP-glycosyltransferase 79B3-like [Malania oleifera]XP_057963862.1 UDP-glycosyltransferase 79B3-like [Malania oleifera]